MKKNITINLFGTLYNIDEDACQLLEQYLQSMKSYFSRQEGGEEIADDIEHRVAELLWQQKQAGIEAVTIEHIRDIIGKIGNPSEIDEPKGDNYDKQEKPHTKENNTQGPDFNQFKQEAGDAFNKFKRESNEALGKAQRYMRARKLYRNPDDKLLGGVLSGIARYFDCDPIWFRLGFILLALVSRHTFFYWAWNIMGFGFSFWTLAYIAMWIIIPLPNTPEDYVRMKGEKVTPESINEEILRQSTEPRTKRDIPAQTAQSGCLKTILGLLMALLLFPFILMFLCLIFCFMLVGSFSNGMLGATFGGMFDSWFPAQMPEYVSNNHVMLWAGMLAGLAVVIIPIYLIIRAMRNNEERLSSASIVSYIAVWLASVVIVGICLGFSLQRYSDWEWQIRHQEYTEPVDSIEETAEEEAAPGDTLIINPEEDIAADNE